MKEKIPEISVSEMIQSGCFIRNDNGFFLDCKILRDYDFDIFNYLLRNPEEFLEESKSQLKSLFDMKQIDETELSVLPKEIINYRIINFDEEIEISSIRVNDVNKLLKIKGMISKITKVIAITERQTFECESCGTLIEKKGLDIPRACSCGQRKNICLKEKYLQDIQEVEIEEIQDSIGDRQPQKIRARLFGNLCEANFSGILQPGNKIEVIGYIQKVKIPKKQIEVEELFEYRLMAINVIPLDEQFNDEVITEEDIKEIKKISKNDPLLKLSESLAPSIYGHGEIKKALILQMVGGVKHRKIDGTWTRDRIHILLCGDPGVAKSKMGKNVHLRMPKSYYVSGDSSTRAGLVAIVDRDPLLGTWQLKCGALSKANGGVLILDEADKLNEEDRESLHTPMEYGKVIINKADIHTELRAECSILAIANPKDGMFDLNNPSSPITKQINLPPSLMSRFDVIFVMTDKIDKENDNAIIDMIFSDADDDEKRDFISIELFRKYISYARKLKPKKDAKLKQILKDNYDDVRGKSISKDSKMRGMPITPRNAEGILRLAEACAKIRLSESVEIQDLDTANKIFYNSLLKLGMDEGTGLIDLGRMGQGKSLNRKLKARAILDIARELIRKGNLTAIKDFELKQVCLEHGIDKYDYEEIIYELNKDGSIIRITEGWQLT